MPRLARPRQLMALTRKPHHHRRNLLILQRRQHKRNPPPIGTPPRLRIMRPRRQQHRRCPRRQVKQIQRRLISIMRRRHCRLHQRHGLPIRRHLKVPNPVEAKDVLLRDPPFRSSHLSQRDERHKQRNNDFAADSSYDSGSVEVGLIGEPLQCTTGRAVCRLHCRAPGQQDARRSTKDGKIHIEGAY
jgi:hypothetical protein